jgi:ankyrin repeat protein
MGNKFAKLSWNDRLINAVKRCDVHLANECLEHMADPDICTDNGESILVIASRFHNGSNLVRILLGHGANPNMISNIVCITPYNMSVQYITPLLTAITHSNSDTIRLLLNAGANPNYKHPKWHSSIVSHIQYVSILQILLNAGLTIDTIDIVQYTLIKKTHNDVIQLLLQNVNSIESLVTYALDNNNDDILTILVENGYIRM